MSFLGSHSVLVRTVLLLLFIGTLLIVRGVEASVDLPFATPTPTPTPLLTFSINDVEDVEGNLGGTRPFTLTITRSFATGTTSIVTYSTADATSFSVTDYQAVSGGTVVFGPNDVSRQVFIQVITDTYAEFDETFSVNITNVSEGTISRSVGTATIISDDPVEPFGTAREGDTVDGNGGPDGDGLVLANDVTAIRQFVLGTATATLGQFARADVNVSCGNGLIDAGDVTVIRQMILGTIPNNTPVCGPIFPVNARPLEAAAALTGHE